MHRSHARLLDIAGGRISTDSSTARDALFHFFQDAYHLKDWLINDEIAVSKRDVERAVSASKELSICADLCNGTKHRALTRDPRTGDPSTAFVGQSVTVHLGSLEQLASIDPSGTWLDPGERGATDAASISGPAGFTTHSWKVQSHGATLDAVKLAGEVVSAWDRWLIGCGLVPRAEPSAT